MLLVMGGAQVGSPQNHSATRPGPGPRTVRNDRQEDAQASTWTPYITGLTSRSLPAPIWASPCRDGWSRSCSGWTPAWTNVALPHSRARCRPEHRGDVVGRHLDLAQTRAISGQGGSRPLGAPAPFLIAQCCSRLPAVMSGIAPNSSSSWHMRCLQGLGGGPVSHGKAISGRCFPLRQGERPWRRGVRHSCWRPILGPTVGGVACGHQRSGAGSSTSTSDRRPRPSYGRAFLFRSTRVRQQALAGDRTWRALGMMVFGLRLACRWSWTRRERGTGSTRVLHSCAVRLLAACTLFGFVVSGAHHGEPILDLTVSTTATSPSGTTCIDARRAPPSIQHAADRALHAEDTLDGKRWNAGSRWRPAGLGTMISSDGSRRRLWRARMDQTVSSGRCMQPQRFAGRMRRTDFGMG